MAVSVSEKRPRQSLRLELQGWDKIDRVRKKRAGNVSRDTWIIEKLSREQTMPKQEKPHA